MFFSGISSGGVTVSRGGTLVRFGFFIRSGL
jgi:hypothetical protein